jgi:SAM-dependent methyltransferase
VSPLRRFHPNLITSDVLDYLDYVFDCHSIDRFEPVADESLDVIALTNVLHHLQNPIDFLNKAAVKLKRGGRVVATEPYLSTLSTLIFRHLHHEPVHLAISEPTLTGVRGPLSSANTALPWLIFFKHASWRDRLRAHYEFDIASFRPFTAIAYMATGGIAHRFPIPFMFYRGLFRIDLALSRAFPRLLASFFTLVLTRDEPRAHLLRLARAEITVARVAQTGNDVTKVVQLRIDCGSQDTDVGMRRMQLRDSGRTRNQTDKLNSARTIRF